LFQTEKEDWRFVVSATAVFALALVVAVWDFVVIQKMIYRFGLLNVIGLVLFLIGISIRVVGRKDLETNTWNI
jgi:membrane-bound ClpP family serine protease